MDHVQLSSWKRSGILLWRKCCNKAFCILSRFSLIFSFRSFPEELLFLDAVTGMPLKGCFFCVEGSVHIPLGMKKNNVLSTAAREEHCFIYLIDAGNFG